METSGSDIDQLFSFFCQKRFFYVLVAKPSDNRDDQHTDKHACSLKVCRQERMRQIVFKYDQRIMKQV